MFIPGISESFHFSTGYIFLASLCCCSMFFHILQWRAKESDAIDTRFKFVVVVVVVDFMILKSFEM